MGGSSGRGRLKVLMIQDGDYRLAVELGIIDANPDVAYEMGVCQ